MKYFYSLFLLLLIQPLTFGTSKNDSTQAIQAYKLSEPIIIDGELNESVYSNPAITEFTQRSMGFL